MNACLCNNNLKSRITENIYNEELKKSLSY